MDTDAIYSAAKAYAAARCRGMAGMFETEEADAEIKRLLNEADEEHKSLLAENERLVDEVQAARKEISELVQKLTEKASLLRGCYAADHKQKQRIEELTAELERIKALPPVAWRSSMGHGVTLKETIPDEQRALTWDGKPMWQPLIALGSKT